MPRCGMNKNSHTIISKLDRDEIARLCGVRDRAIRAAAQQGIPASWYLAIRSLCEEAGIECDDKAFNFKTPDTAPDAEARNAR